MFVKVALVILLSVEIESCPPTGPPAPPGPVFHRGLQKEGQDGEVNMDRMMGRMGPE